MAIDKKVFITDYVQETLENLNQLFDLTILVNKDNRNKESLTEILRLLHTLKGSSRILEFYNIEKIAHTLENIFKDIQNNQREISLEVNKLLINSIAVLKEAIKSVKEKGTDDVPEYETVIKNLKAASSGESFSSNFISASSKDNQEKFSEDDNESFDTQIIKINVSQISEILKSYDKLIMSQIKMKNLLFSEEISHDLQEIIAVMEKQTFEIQEEITSLCMLPLEMVLQPIKQSVATEAINLEKNVNFNIPHSDIKIDKAILETLPKILLHLVRNSLDHGIESPEVRKSFGKSPVGNISITVRQQFSRIFISISDDGAGIDYDKIRIKAQEKFPDKVKEISQMDEASLNQYLFMSGFSTRDSVTELSGRGVGLDVVREEMENLKGKISLTSKKNEGTTFELSLPASLSTQDGLYVREGENKYLIYSHYVHAVLTVKKSDFIQMQYGPVLAYNNELIPVFDFNMISGSAAREVDIEKEFASVVIVEYLNRKTAIIADEISDYDRVVVKALPPIMKNFEGLQGVVFDEKYSLVPVLNIPYCMKKFRSVSAFKIKDTENKKQKKIYSILVADDSHVTRNMEKIILEQEGYNVSTACDGIEAIEQLKSNSYDLLISDVRMPRMDGFVLIDNIRHTQELKNLPVIFVTSYYENEVREKIKKIDNLNYIAKSSFHSGELVSAVKEMLSK